MKETFEKNIPQWLSLYCELFGQVRVAVLLYGENQKFAKPRLSRRMNPIYPDKFTEADLVNLEKIKEVLIKDLEEKRKQIKKAK
jgi:hypothetical protein